MIKWQPFCRRQFQIHFHVRNSCILIQISLKFVPKGPITNIPALVQIMTWRWTGDKPLSEPMMVTQPGGVNSLWPSDVICWQRSGSTLAQIMARCLMAPSHYLNQRWLLIGRVQWHSSECNLTRDTSAISHWNNLEKYLSKILFKFSRSQWVKNQSENNGILVGGYNYKSLFGMLNCDVCNFWSTWSIIYQFSLSALFVFGNALQQFILLVGHYCFLLFCSEQIDPSFARNIEKKILHFDSNDWCEIFWIFIWI